MPRQIRVIGLTAYEDWPGLLNLAYGRPVSERGINNVTVVLSTYFGHGVLPERSVFYKTPQHGIQQRELSKSLIQSHNDFR